MILQLGDDLQLDSQFGGHFEAKEHFCRPFCSPFYSCEMRGVELRNGTRVLRGGFTAAKHPAKFSQLTSLSFAQLSSNSHNFFVSAPIHAPFEALDSRLPDIRNKI